MVLPIILVSERDNGSRGRERPELCLQPCVQPFDYPIYVHHNKP
ncbi:hypothetical protein E2C01_012003 [Portunus trituberculatus]|uniref:Uncharacterized protein n=1 Tax=Portunus trituberculatus TaxID=210409 RepID=A0A5B7DDG2_PORTR|nr:hypothetical protein [Portunus trituberculatus]